MKLIEFYSMLKPKKLLPYKLSISTSS